MTNKHLTLNQLITLEKFMVRYVDDVKDSFETDDELADFINVCRHIQKRIYSYYNL